VSADARPVPERRRVVIQARATEAERADVWRLARHLGVSESEAIRHAVAVALAAAGLTAF